MWIYKKTNWPNFSWDDKILVPKLGDIRHRQGKLLGQMQNLGFELKLEAKIKTLTRDIVKSSAIEGNILDPTEVRSSIARKLGIDEAGLSSLNRDVEGIVEVMLDATQKFTEPLSKERLLAWHAALFPTGYSGLHPIKVASWRDDNAGPMQVVSGAIGKEKIHFEAPAAEILDSEMQIFLIWFANTDIDPVLKAGIAHFWFVTIHPFEDGNGRIGRAISDMALAQADGSQERFYSLSSQIEIERKDYYIELEKQQKASLEITAWLEWYLDCLGRAINNAESSLESILFKAELWTRINQKPVNERQRKVLNLMLDEDFKGHMNTSKYAKLCNCSNDTALRDIQDLKERGIFIQNSGAGRSTSYRLIKDI